MYNNIIIMGMNLVAPNQNKQNKNSGILWVPTPFSVSNLQMGKTNGQLTTAFAIVLRQ